MCCVFCHYSKFRDVGQQFFLWCFRCNGTIAGDRPPRYGRVEINSRLPISAKTKTIPMKNRNGTIFFLTKKLTKFDNVRIINSSIVNLLHVVLKFQKIWGFSHFSLILI